MSDDLLTEELRELGRTLPLAPTDPDALVHRIMTHRIMTQREVARRQGADLEDVAPEPAGHTGSAMPVRVRRRRSLAALAVSLLIVLALTPPVRAAVVDWFGVIVRPGAPAEEASVPGVESTLSVDQARGLVGFEPVLPASLGRPDGIEVSADRRVLSMSWTRDGGTVRLDQFDGSLVPVFLKRGAAEQIQVAGRPAAWFDGPHYLTALDELGLEFGASPRSAGPTLIWETHGGITLRLEGADREHAVDIAHEVLGTR